MLYLCDNKLLVSKKGKKVFACLLLAVEEKGGDRGKKRQRWPRKERFACHHLGH
jgi:hypothetical protein